MAEPKETLSRPERAFDAWRKGVGLFAGPLAALIVWWLDLPALTPKAHTLAAILAWTVVWWICEPVPLAITALLSSVLCVMLGVGEAKTVFAPYADPIIYLFLGSFMLAEAMAIHGLDKRFAYAIMSLRFVGNSTARILLAFGFICAFLSMWISNTAATAMMFPIAIGIVGALADIDATRRGSRVDPRSLRFGTGMMYFLVYALHKPEVARVAGGTEFVKAERARLGAWTRGQKNALLCFLVTVSLWLAPGLLALILGDASPVARGFARVMPESVAAICGAVLLFLLPVDWKKREFTISWEAATRIDWGTLLLFGGGLTLGSLMFETRLGEVIGTHLLNLSGATSVWGITLGAIYIAMLVSETSSNTASANMVIPVMIALAQAAGVNPIAPAIGATLGASWGFMLPVSTPPNAIVYGSGMVPITAMIRAGVFYDLLGGLVIWAGLYVLLPIVGLV